MAIRFGAGVIFGDVTPGSTTTQRTLGLGVSLAQQNNQTGSVQFNGSTQYLTVPSNSAFQFGTGDFTVETWVYLNNLGGYNMIFENGGAAGGDTSGFSLGVTVTTGKLYLYTNGTFIITGTTTLSLSTWYHVAITRNAGTTTLWVNGVNNGTSVTSYNYTGTGVSGQGVLIGKNAASGEYIRGYLSNYRVVKGTAVYNANFTPSTAPLIAIANTVLLTAQSSSSITDASTNAFTITNNGTALASTNNPFVGGSTLLSGSSQYLSVASNSAFAFGTGDFTVELWFYLNQLASNNVTGTDTSNFLFDFRNGANAAVGTLLLNSGISYRLTYTNGTAGIDSISTPSAGQWNHVAISRQSGTTRMFLNGVLQSSYSDSVSYIAAPVFIGTCSDANGPTGTGTFKRFMNGYVSNFRVVKGTALYTSAFTPSTAPLTAITNTSLLTAQSKTSVTTDASTNVLTITNNGSAVETSLSPFSTIVSAFPPDAPNITALVGSDTSVTYTFEPPSFNGNSAITSYTAMLSSSAGSTSTSVSGSSGATVTFSGLTAGTAYTARVYAANSVGTSVSSYPYSTSTFSLIPVSYLVVAGGGGGGGNTGAGGGGGGVLAGSFLDSVASKTYNIIVGGGGSGGTAAAPPVQQGQRGGNSLLYSNDVMGSLYFPNTSYLQWPDNSTANALQSNNFTIEGWFYFGLPQSTVSNCYMHVDSSGNWTANCIWLGKHPVVSGKFSFWAYNNSNTAPLVYDPTMPTQGWMHYAVVRNGSTFTIYRNGTSVATATYAGSITGTTVRKEYHGDGADQQNMQGYLSNFRIVNGTAVYTSNFTPSTVQTQH
jgi:Concanavalin A-like lectin/glucanases superfamily/Fibronectin type III domain